MKEHDTKIENSKQDISVQRSTRVEEAGQGTTPEGSELSPWPDSVNEPGRHKQEERKDEKNRTRDMKNMRRM